MTQILLMSMLVTYEKMSTCTNDRQKLGLDPVPPRMNKGVSATVFYELPPSPL